MLILSRRTNEKICLGNGVTLMVVQIQKDKVRLGIDAPNDVLIYREEIAEDFVKKHENKKLLK